MQLPQNYNQLSWRQRKSVREQYVRDQGEKCYYCGGDINLPPPKHIRDKKINWKLFPPNFLKHKIHLHHSHQTGMTIGAVHAYCNAVLWQYHGE